MFMEDGTMPLDYLPQNDRELLAWLKNFNRVAANNKAALGFTEDDLTELMTAEQAFDAKLSANDTAQQAALAATQEKNTAHKAAEKLARRKGQGIQAREGVSAGLKDQLGLTVRDGVRSVSTAETPIELVAMPHADGTNTLKWKAGGNKSGTQYLIEAKVGESGAWALVDAVTRISYTHTNQTPGQKVRYRVRAKRGDKTSGYSNVAGVYGG
jgi:hypothetical protein